MSDRPDLNKNEGEGSRTAARNYYAKLRSFIRENRVEPAARDAKDYVEHHPNAAAKAESKAKAGPRPMRRRIEDAVTEGRALLKRARTRVRAIIDKRADKHRR